MSSFSKPLTKIVSNAAVGAGIGAAAGAYAGGKSKKIGAWRGSLIGAGVGASAGIGLGAHRILTAPKSGPAGWSQRTKDMRAKYGMPTDRRLEVGEEIPIRPAISPM